MKLNNGIRDFSTSVTLKQSLCDGRWHRIAGEVAVKGDHPLIKVKNPISCSPDIHLHGLEHWQCTSVFSSSFSLAKTHVCVKDKVLFIPQTQNCRVSWEDKHRFLQR